MTVRPLIGRGLADDAAVQALLPKQLAVLGIPRPEPAVQGPVEHHAAGRYQRAAPDRHILMRLAGDLLASQVPSGQSAAIIAAALLLADIGAHIRRAGN